MALIAYLMEHKHNYGPHLIIVPNAVMVNWKSELSAWLPSAKCVYYVGHKDERARKYNMEVASLQFNVLVTTYEYIMRDRLKLSKVRPCMHSSPVSYLECLTIFPRGSLTGESASLITHSLCCNCS